MIDDSWRALGLPTAAPVPAADASALRESLVGA